MRRDPRSPSPARAPKTQSILLLLLFALAVLAGFVAVRTLLPGLALADAGAPIIPG
jgi:hypothetical protein